MLPRGLRAFCVFALTTLAIGCEQGPSDPEPSWRAVSDVLVENGCADGNCHNSDAAAGALDLLGAEAYDELVGVPCANHNAAAGGLLRVASGDPDASFLLSKLTIQVVDPALGAPMPPVGEPLAPEELDLIRAWIEDGAPR